MHARPFSTMRFLAVSLLASGSLACTSVHPRGVEPGDGCLVPFSGQGCVAGEKMVFAGDVQDDFGLGVAVCVSGHANADQARISVRYSGEGGGRAVSCVAAQCDGVIELDHYVRPRFTILTLRWRDESGEQRIVESFDAQDHGEKPVHLLTHFWVAPGQAGRDADSVGHRVIAHSEPLSLLQLQTYLGSGH